MSLIVVGFDGSQRSHDALALARELAEPAGAALLLATAVPYPALALVGEGIAVAVTRQGAVTGARLLDHEVAALAADGVDAEGVVRPYDSAPQLLQTLAQERDAALIVVGSASSGRLGRVLPGTTGERLLAGAPCPVAVAPSGHSLTVSGRARRVGVAFDGSAEAHAALRAGAAVASNPGDTLEVIAVLDAFRYGAPALMGGPGYHRMRADVEAAARARLDAALATLPPALAARGVLLGRRPRAGAGRAKPRPAPADRRLARVRARSSRAARRSERPPHPRFGVPPHRRPARRTVSARHAPPGRRRRRPGAMTDAGDTPSELRLVLADDHQLVRAGIRMLLESVPGWRVVAEAGDGDAALRAGARPPAGHPGPRPRDAGPPEPRSAPRAGAPGARYARGGPRRWRPTRRSRGRRSRAGAAAYVLKEAADAELVQAIRAVAHGGTLPRSLARGARRRRAVPEDDDHEPERPRARGPAPDRARAHQRRDRRPPCASPSAPWRRTARHIQAKTGCRTRARARRSSRSPQDLIVPRAPSSPTEREAPMTTRVAINGFGRIGRAVVRAADRARRRPRDRRGQRRRRRRDARRSCSRSTRVYGRFAQPVGTDGDGARRRRPPRSACSPSADPAALPWSELGVDVVIEATGPLPHARAAPRGTSTPARAR